MSVVPFASAQEYGMVTVQVAVAPLRVAATAASSEWTPVRTKVVMFSSITSRSAEQLMVSVPRFVDLTVIVNLNTKRAAKRG